MRLPPARGDIAPGEDALRADGPAGSAPLLTARNLHMTFGGVRAVAGVSFAVERGRTIGLIGPNGAGKSTVVSMLAGGLKPTGGTVSFNGRDITGTPPFRVARLGLIRTFQLSSQFSRLTVLENLLVGARRTRDESFGGMLLGRRYWEAREQERLERARGLLRQFEMTIKENELAGDLSGGQRRLVELMRALMSEPAMLLLDEPMAGVNPVLVGHLEEHLLRLRDSGLTMLVVEHELGFIERLCQSVVVMAQGSIIAEGSMQAVRRSPEVIDAYIGA